VVSIVRKSERATVGLALGCALVDGWLTSTTTAGSGRWLGTGNRHRVSLGAKLGMSEGTKLGASEGTEVAALLGALEGPFDGALEGDAVGTLDGYCDGKTKGLAEGELTEHCWGRHWETRLLGCSCDPNETCCSWIWTLFCFRVPSSFRKHPFPNPCFSWYPFSTCRRIFISGLLGASLSSLSSWLAELSPLIDLLLPLLFVLLDFLEEGSPKRISRKSLSFSKRDKSLWAGDCVGSNLGTAVSGANGLTILAEEDKSPFLFLDIDDDLLLDDFVYFGVPEPLVDNTLAFFRFSASSHINHGIRVKVA
jgi:hypothetical protein